MIHDRPKGKKIRSIVKPAQQNPVYSMSEFPKDEPGVIYVRQSSIKQMQNNIHSFEMQTDKFIEYFREQMRCTGYIETIADDEGVSGTKDIHERAGLTRLMRLIEGKELLKGKRVGWVGAVHVNRLTRDKWLVTPGTIMKECYEHNVWVATLRMNFNFQDEYCRRVFMIEAEESARHLEWMKLVLGGGRITASSNGYYDGRWIAPGYMVDRSDEKKKKYVPYEPHAEIVKWLFRRFFDLDGDFPQLCREVAEKPFLFPAFEPWVDPKTVSKFSGNKGEKRGSLITEGPNAGCYRVTMHGLKSILTNPVYIGWWLPIGGGVVENNHPAIIDDALFTFAHKRLSIYDLTGERQKPERVNRRGEGKGILKKVLYDDEGKLMYVHFGEDGKARFRYRSLAANGITSPTYRYSVEVAEYDQIFLEKLFERIQVLENLDWADKLQERLGNRRKQLEEKKSLLRKQIDRATRQRAEIMETLSDPDIPKSKQMKIDYANQAAGLEQKIHQWELELAAPLNEEDDEEITLYQIHSLLPDIKQDWHNLSFAVRLRFVGALVRKVVLTPVAPSWMKLEIYWKSAIGNYIDVGYIRKFQANGSKWTREEDAIIQELYPTADGAEILKRLPGRTWRSILIRASKLKITRELKNVTNPVVIDKGRIKGRIDWTEEEDAIIREKYPLADPLEILELLPGRTWNGVVKHASKLGVLREVRAAQSRVRMETEARTVDTSNKTGLAWTEEEDAILREMFNMADPVEVLKALPGRTWVGINHRADRIGMAKRGQAKLPPEVIHAGRVRVQLSWTEEENAVLREMYPEAEPEEILKRLLPHRTWQSVRAQASKLKIARKHGKTPNSILLSDQGNVTIEDKQFEEEVGLISNVRKVQWLE